MTVRLIAVALVGVVLCPVAAAEVTRLCQGNIETFAKKVVQTGVSYKLNYEISGQSAKVRFAGREFEARVELGKSWKGPWIKRIDENIYFSYLPEDGGTIKFEFEPERWFSGNC